MILAALAAVGVGLLTQRSDAGPRSSSRALAARLTSVDVGGGYVLAAQAAGDRIWVTTCVALCGAGDTGLDQERLVEFDAGSGAVIRRLRPLTNMTGFTVAGHSIWVAQFLSGEVTRVDPATGRTTARLHLRLPVPLVRHDRRFLPESLSYANGYVWASSARGWIAQIDATTGRLVRMLRTPSENNSTSADRYGTWVAEDLDGIGRLAPGASRLRIHAVMQAGLPLAVHGVLAGGGVVWALASPDTLETSIAGSAKTIVLLIDPRSGRVLRRVPVPAADGAVVTGGALYLGDLARGRIYRVSADGVLQTLATPRHAAWLATASKGALWAAATSTKRARLLRIRLPGA